MIVDTLVFDESQITCPLHYENPQWGGQCPSLAETNAGRMTVIISELSECDRDIESRATRRKL